MAYTTIDKPTDYFNTVLYTGNGTDDHSITGVGFQPDFLWIKSRSASTRHSLQNSVVGMTNFLRSNGTNAEATGGVKTADSDGFTVDTSGMVNANSETFVSWNWLAGGSASSNSNGSITSSVSANTTAGFSIVSYTGNGSANQTAGHGLGVTPKIKILKNRDASGAWTVTGSILGTDKRFFLNTTDAVGTVSGFYPDDTSSAIGLSGSNSGSGHNTSSEKYIAYCFAEKKGYSKFGSYTGNGNADGTFIYTGFAVSWLMMKRTDSAGEWLLYDNKRDPFNLRDTRLEAQDSFADSTGTTKVFDFLSNGFKCKGSDTDINASGGNYIFMAFAESPFVNSNGVPNNAR